MSPDIGATAAFGVLALLILVIGAKKGFFQLPSPNWIVPIRLMHLIGAFAIYFIVTTFSAQIFLKLFQREIMLNYMGFSSWLNFGISLLVLCALVIYLCSLPKALRWGILRREGLSYAPKEDLWAALYAWILAFPLVLFLSQVLEILIVNVFKITVLPEQVAVKFLKSTFENPTYFVLALISITILAPLIEETLFRGFLQSFIRKHLGRSQAILITSICFALFHYSAGQGLGNISIILSLFVLALFLGFLYEKQGSLLAPILLHASFNTVSVVNLYLFGGFTTGI